MCRGDSQGNNTSFVQNCRTNEFIAVYFASGYNINQCKKEVQILFQIGKDVGFPSDYLKLNATHSLIEPFRNHILANCIGQRTKKRDKVTYHIYFALIN